MLVKEKSLKIYQIVLILLLNTEKIIWKFKNKEVYL
jgi:hypothetical protein